MWRRFACPCMYDRTMKASVFEKWFEDELLRYFPKGWVIIMDSAAFYQKDFTAPCGKILAETDFSAAVIRRNKISLFWNFSFRTGYLEMRYRAICAILNSSTCSTTSNWSNPLEHTWIAPKRKVAGCVYRYGSVSQALNAVLKGRYLYLCQEKV